MQGSFVDLVRSKKRGVSLFSLAASMMVLSACGSDASDDNAVGSDGFADEAAEAAGDEQDNPVLAQEAPGESSCLANITNYGPRGPYQTQARTVGRIKFIVPRNIPAGCKVPVAHIANGTGASCGIYGSIGQTLASHGFIVTCYENTNTGAGTQGLEAFRTALREYPQQAARKFASLGHSQGGQAAFVVQALAEAEFGPDAQYAGLAMQPASGFGSQPAGGWQNVYARIKSPMFAFSGTADILVSESWVRRGFDALNNNVEAYHWSASGATHIPTPNVETSEISVPWFRWKLLGDQGACRRFYELERGSRWRQVQVQNAVACN